MAAGGADRRSTSHALTAQVGIVAAHLDRAIEVRTEDPATTRERMPGLVPEPVVDSLPRSWAEFPDGPAPVTSEVAERAGHPARAYAVRVTDTL